MKTSPFIITGESSSWFSSISLYSSNSSSNRHHLFFIFVVVLSVLDVRWLILYVPVLCILEAYRTAAFKNHVIAARNDVPFCSFVSLAALSCCLSILLCIGKMRAKTFEFICMNPVVLLGLLVFVWLFARTFSKKRKKKKTENQIKKLRSIFVLCVAYLPGAFLSAGIYDTVTSVVFFGVLVLILVMILWGNPLFEGNKKTWGE